MTKLVLVEGPVGAGKTTHGRMIAAESPAPVFVLDDWYVSLYGASGSLTMDPAEYLNRKDRLIARMWITADAVLRAGVSVVLELGLIRRAERLAFYERVADSGHTLQVHFVDAPIALRRERVALRNVLLSDSDGLQVSPEDFERANHLWEPPEFDETASIDCVDYDMTAPLNVVHLQK